MGNTEESEKIACLEEENAALRDAIKAYEDSIKSKKKLRDFIFLWAFKIIAGQSLIESFGRFFKVLYEKRSPNPQELADFSAAIVHRFTRIGIIGFMVALLPSVLLVWQNILIGEQNQFLERADKFQISQRNLSLKQEGINLSREIISEIAKAKSTLGFCGNFKQRYELGLADATGYKDACNEVLSILSNIYQKYIVFETLSSTKNTSLRNKLNDLSSAYSDIETVLENQESILESLDDSAAKMNDIASSLID